MEEAEKNTDVDAVIWKTRDGRIHPVCGWYSSGCIPVLEKQLLERNGRVRDLLGKLRVKILETEKEHVPDTWFTNVNTPMALSELADKRPPVFAVSGKKNTGKTFKEYVLDMRIGYACKLLNSSMMNISQISATCGFESPVHFNRIFKRVTGMTPTLYREQME
mgnify:CR=1 FL=1